jgi:hypothetical protein
VNYYYLISAVFVGLYFLWNVSFISSERMEPEIRWAGALGNSELQILMYLVVFSHESQSFD